MNYRINRKISLFNNHDICVLTIRANVLIHKINCNILICELSRRTHKVTFNKFIVIIGHYDNGQGYHLYVLPQQSSVISNNYARDQPSLQFPSGNVGPVSVGGQSMLMGQNPLQIEVLPTSDGTSSMDSIPVSQSVSACWSSMSSQPHTYQTTAAINGLDNSHNSRHDHKDESSESQHVLTPKSHNNGIEFTSNIKSEIAVKTEKG